MFLGRNRVPAQGVGLGEGNVGGETALVNPATPPIPLGMQRFLARKGINSPEDLANRLQFAPRISFRRGR